MSAKTLFRFFLLISLSTLGLIGFASWQYFDFVNQPLIKTISSENNHSTSAPLNKIEFLVNKGANSQQISQKLFELKLISDPQKMYWLGKLTKNWRKIKVGEYALSAAQSPAEIFDTITSGVSIQRPFTIKEGANIYEIANIFEQKGIATRDDALSILKSTDLLFSELPQFQKYFSSSEQKLTMEGFLFPETYFYNRSMTAIEIIKMMLKKFKTTWTPEFEDRAKQLGMTSFQIIVLASMIEKETGAISERPLISSVFHNRLKKPMRLQSDPTTIYGIWERYQGNLKVTDLRESTPYNTYTISALPVGPIGNPGAEAIKAALYPAESEFLFFVSHNDGTHEFTKTYAEHLKAVKKFQIDPKAREGKSWRDLAKKNQ